MQLQTKKVIKAIIHVIRERVPERYFDKFLGLAYAIYKAAVRFLYLAKGAWNHGRHDREKWEMVKIIYAMLPYTLVGVGGLEVSYLAVKELDRRRVEGDVVELGVARGGCAAVMGKAMFSGTSACERNLWLFDSYAGLPEPTRDDFDPGRGGGTGDHVRPLPEGSCLGTMAEVKSLMFETCGFPADRVIFVKGWFQDTIPETEKRIGKIALLRVDGDWYESTKVCLEGLYDKVAPGGMIIIDDYQSCYGCEKAVDEFLKKEDIRVDMKFDGRGGCYFEKPANIQYADV